MEFVPYLFITGGRCEEALNFYKRIFGGEIGQIMRWKEAPAEMGLPAELGNRIMHSTFTSPAVKFMASDAQPTTQYGDGAISLSLGTKDVSEAKRLFDALSQGGKVEVPLEKAFWGAMFGMFTDKYGIDWMVNGQLEQ
ncbi:MAG TPA: VOC family protein [Candidatus Tumulicola sp.]|nr:VOC family protein [Candidatus Tumulicola sp.]